MIHCSNDPSACLDEEFECSDSTCIDLSRKCDGVRDCSDGEDEDNCGKLQELRKFLLNVIDLIFNYYSTNSM